MLNKLLNKFSVDVGIDLGTCNTPVVVRGRGIRLREPSYVAVDIVKGDIIAVGYEAKLMEGRNPKRISVIRPLKDGVITNFEMVQAMINHFLKRIRTQKLFKPRVIVGVPSDATDVEKKAVFEASRLAGARAVYLVEQPLAAAIGAGLKVESAYGNMIVDIGGGTTGVAVISLGGIVVSRSTNMAGDKADSAIISYIKRNFDLLIGKRTAEEIKIYLGEALPSEEIRYMNVRGRNLNTGLPQIIEINSHQICEALQEIVKSIEGTIKSALEATPPELSVDIIENGIVLSGGGALLRNLDEFLTQTIGVNCHLAPEPVLSVCWGLDKIFKSLKLMQTIFKSKKSFYFHKK